MQASGNYTIPDITQYKKLYLIAFNNDQLSLGSAEMPVSLFKSNSSKFNLRCNWTANTSFYYYDVIYVSDTMVNYTNGGRVPDFAELYGIKY